MHKQTILIQQKCVEALKGKTLMPRSLTLDEKIKMVDKVMCVIILSLRDKVIREVVGKKIVAKMWVKLESLYMTKFLDHKLCLKQQLYSF